MSDDTGQRWSWNGASWIEMGESEDVVVAHKWGPNTWDDFEVIVRTPDPDAEWVRTTEDGRGVVTAIQASGGDSLRTMALHPDTIWSDGEIVSLIWPPSKWTGANTQMGHTHRVREISPGVHEAINVWTSVVFGGTYGTLHVAAVINDGSSPTLQSAVENDTGSDAEWIDRRSPVHVYRRFEFSPDWLNEYELDRHRDLATHLRVGDIVTVDQMPETSFNLTDQAIVGPAMPGTEMRPRVQIVDPSSTTAVDFTASFSGRLVPSGESEMKRWAPFYLATRVRGGSTTRVPVEIKRWRLGEPEPSWGDARVRRVDVVPDADVPEMPLGPGRHGLLDAHLNDDTFHSWGDVEFRRT